LFFWRPGHSQLIDHERADGVKNGKSRSTGEPDSTFAVGLFHAYRCGNICFHLYLVRRESGNCAITRDGDAMSKLSAALLITASQCAMAALGLLILVVIADLTYRVIPSSHLGMNR
jgi:hypothetical protein